MATVFGRRVVFFDRATFSWTAVLAGVAAALIVLVMLTMLGIGIGLISIDPATAARTPVGVSWGAFLYWAIAGIIAAFVGGWVAGAVTEPGTGAAHGLAAWAVATLIVIGGATLMATSTASIASNLLGPIATSVARLDSLTRGVDERGTVGQRTANQQEIESARRAVAGAALASFIALLIGALAALLGGLLGSRTGDLVEREARVMR